MKQKVFMWKSCRKNPICGAHNGQFPLSFCRDGEKVTIASVSGGRKLHNRISELGLLPGTMITVIQSHHRGPILIRYKGSNLVLGYGLAQHLLVSG